MKSTIKRVIKKVAKASNILKPIIKLKDGKIKLKGIKFTIKW